MAIRLNNIDTFQDFVTLVCKGPNSLEYDNFIDACRLYSESEAEYDEICVRVMSLATNPSDDALMLISKLSRSIADLDCAFSDLMVAFNRFIDTFDYPELEPLRREIARRIMDLSWVSGPEDDIVPLC